MPFKIENAKEVSEAKVVTETETELRPPDGGWGWVVCFAAFMTNFTVTGITSSSGIILLALLDLYHESISKTSLVGSIISGAAMFGGPLTLVLFIYKVSHRQVIMIASIVSAASAIASFFAPNIETLIFTYGILVGVSLAGPLFAANVIVGCYFDKRRALAIGIANSGAGCGSILVTYLTEKCISFYGMRGTFLLIGGLFLNLNVYGALCRPLKPVNKQTSKMPESRRVSAVEKEWSTNLGFIPEDEISDTESEKSVPSYEYVVEEIAEIPNTLQMRRLSALSDNPPSDFVNLKSRFCDASMFKNKYFLLLMFTYLFWAVGDSMMIYLPPYADSIGLSRQEGALVVAIYGAIGTLSQIATGFLIDVIHIPTSYLYCVSLFGVSLSIAFIPYCQTFTTLVLDCGIIAMSYSCGMALRIVMVASVLGIEKMPKGYSILSMAIGVGYAVYPLISGIVYDMTGLFPLVFHLDSASVFMGIILSLGLVYGEKKGKFAE